jgi:hypothetical protein
MSNFESLRQKSKDLGSREYQDSLQPKATSPHSPKKPLQQQQQLKKGQLKYAPAMTEDEQEASKTLLFHNNERLWIWHQHLAMAYFDIGDYANFMQYADTALKLLGFPSFLGSGDIVDGKDTDVRDNGKWILWMLTIQSYLPSPFVSCHPPSELNTVAACLLYEKYTQLCMEYNVRYLFASLRISSNLQLLLLLLCASIPCRVFQVL